MAPDLIARYESRRLPRYTSYPTAPHFTPEVGPDAFGAWLDGVPAGAELSLYLHLWGCHTAVVRRYEPVAAYVDLLDREIGLVARRLSSRGVVAHIHGGGGTPTLLRGPDLLRIGRRTEESFDHSSGAEIAVEIDPRTLTPGHVEALAGIGVNRVSLGVQGFDARVQETIRRVQSFEETSRAAGWLRAAGVASLSLDLLYGLPHQTVANVTETVDRALEIGPDRLSLFGYAHVPWMKRHEALLPEAALPGGAERVAQFEAAARRIGEAGFVRIGLDHFARPEDPLAVEQAAGALRRNFQGYTTDGAPILLGLGDSAISSLPQGYAQNAPAVPEYRRLIEAGSLATARGIALTDEDRLRREIIERLMCDLDADLGEICARHGARPEAFAPELDRIDAPARDGLATRRGARITVSESARDLVRVVGAVFDARLAAKAARHAGAI